MLALVKWNFRQLAVDEWCQIAMRQEATLSILTGIYAVVDLEIARQRQDPCPASSKGMIAIFYFLYVDHANVI